MDEDKKIWKRNEVFKLIARYEQYPELYNARHADYRNKAKKKQILNAIAKDFDISVVELTKKLRILRTQYCLHSKKINKSKEEGNSDNTESTWEYFKALRFLEPCISSRENPTVLKFPSFTVEGNSEQICCDIEPIPLDLSDSDTSASPTPTPAKRNKVSRSSNEINEVNATNPIKIFDQNDDEYEIFGEFVANEMRNMHFDKNKRELKRLIQQDIIEITRKDDEEYFGS